MVIDAYVNLIDSTTKITSAYYAEHGTTSVGQAAATQEQIRIFPNPTTDILNISLPKNVSNPQIIVTDVTGRSMPIAASLASSGYTINTAQLPTGMYLLRVRTAQGGQVLKFEKL